MKGLTAKQLQDFGFFDLSLEQQIVWFAGYMSRLVNGLLKGYEGMQVAIANGLGIQNYNTTTPQGAEKGTAVTSFTGKFVHEVYDTIEAPYKSVSSFIPDVEIEISKDGNSKSKSVVVEEKVKPTEEDSQFKESEYEQVEVTEGELKEEVVVEPPPKQQRKTRAKSSKAQGTTQKKPRKSSSAKSATPSAFEGSTRRRKPKPATEEEVVVPVREARKNPLL